MMREKRTTIDFSKHELKIIKNENVIVYEYKRPNTGNCAIRYINAYGVLTVTGDFGNWVFCREFHPSADTKDGVSGGYWDEKLQISSVQKAMKYDADETTKRIKEFKDTFQDYYGREMNQEEKDWVETLENNVDDEHEYIYQAYRENPNTIDLESVPFGEKRHFWLEAIYDGFDCMCEAMKKEAELTPLNNTTRK